MPCRSHSQHSNRACLSMPPFGTSQQHEDSASCFQPFRADRCPRPTQVRASPEYPIDSPHEPRSADLRCLRCPSEATKPLVDRFDAPPRTFWKACWLCVCLVPSAYSEVSVCGCRARSSALRCLFRRASERSLQVDGRLPGRRFGKTKSRLWKLAGRRAVYHADHRAVDGRLPSTG